MSLDNADSNEIDDLILDESNDDISNNVDQSDDEDNDLDIEIEGEEDSQPSEDNVKESSVINNLRKKLRDANNKLKSIPANAPQEQIIVLGEKPTLESCDLDIDKYEADLASYYERKEAIAKQEAAKQNQSQEIQRQQREQLKEYETQKNALGVRNFDAIQQKFVEGITKEQGSAILRAASNKALMVYTLGSKPDLLDRLSDITDPFKLAAEVGKLESKIKMTKRTNAPKPEQQVRGRVAVAASETSDKTLAKLEAEAERTGDRSKVAAYKKQLRNK